MRALVKAEAKEGLVLRDEPIPRIGPDDILIKVAKTGICGTDLHIWKWDQWAQKTIPVPMVVGHEYAGAVTEIGSHVRTVKVGDRVSGEGHLIGMKSRMARAGHFHLDPETKGVGVNVPGAFAEYLKLPAFNAIHLPPEVDDEIGAILDPLGNAVHTALTYDLVGEDVLITGAGPIGIMAAAVCRHVGARHIVITDVNDYRLELCNQVTDAVTVNVSKEDLKSVMQRIGMREGFDVGLEMSGAPQAFDQMADHIITGGKIAMLGIPSQPVPVDWNRVIFKSLTIKGIYGREMFETWYKMIAMLQSGLDVRKVITHRMKAADFATGFALMKQGSCGKVVLDWNWESDMLSAYGTDKGCLTEFPALTDAVPEGVVWIDMVEPTFDEEKVVEAALKIDIPTREELAEIEASSRLYQEDGAAFMTANLIRRGENDRPESSPVTFIIKGNQLVTIRYHHPQAFPVYVHRAMKPQSTAMTGWGIFVSLLEAVVDRAADHLERVGLIVDETSRKTFNNSRTTSGRKARKKPINLSDLLEKIGEEGDFNSKMRESLVSIGRMVAFMQAIVDQTRQTKDMKDNRARIKVLQRDIQSLTDHASFLNGKISFLLDAVLGMSTIEQNGIIKIFSVAAVVFLPPTLVASIYGMNFKLMPELEWTLGYPMALGLMVLSAFLPWLYFKRKGWL